MAISLRLDARMEQELNKFAKLKGKPKSALIRDMISDFIEKNSKKLSPWELGKDLFGTESSGLLNLAEDRKKILKDKLNEKNRRY